MEKNRKYYDHGGYAKKVLESHENEPAPKKVEDWSKFAEDWYRHKPEGFYSNGLLMLQSFAQYMADTQKSEITDQTSPAPQVGDWREEFRQCVLKNDPNAYLQHFDQGAEEARDWIDQNVVTPLISQIEELKKENEILKLRWM